MSGAARSAIMLPHFPKTHKQTTKVRNTKFWEGYYAASPILSQIGARPQREGRNSSFQNEQGKIERIDYQKKSITIQCKLEDVWALGS